MTKPANTQPTFTLEALRAIIATPEAKALFTEIMRETRQETTAQDRSADMERATVKAFARAGFKDVKPRVDTLTYNRWLEQGFKVRPGEHAIKVKNLRLFHRSQVEAMTAADKKEALANLEAKKANTSGEPAPQPVPEAAHNAPPSRKNTKVLINDPGNA